MTRRKRFRVRFGLRHLSVVGTLACLVGGWLASNYHEYSREQAAIQKVRRLPREATATAAASPVASIPGKAGEFWYRDFM